MVPTQPHVIFLLRHSTWLTVDLASAVTAGARLHRPLALARLYDELRTPLTSAIRPQPLCPDPPPIAKSREKRNVDTRPHQPRREPAQLDNAGIKNGET